MKAFRKAGRDISPEEIKNVSFERIAPSEISEGDKWKMREIYFRNYKEKYPKLAEEIIEGFDKELADDTNQFHILRYQGNIFGFFRLKKESDSEAVYFGAFNIDSSHKNSGLGEVMMKHSLDKIAEDSIIEAHAIPDEIIAQNYIERGFIGSDLKDELGEVKLLHIFENKKENNFFETKKLTHDEIIKMAQAPKAESPFVCRVLPPGESAQGVMREFFRDGYVLTRFFTKQNLRYLAFERFPADVKEKYLSHSVRSESAA